MSDADLQLKELQQERRYVCWFFLPAATMVVFFATMSALELRAEPPPAWLGRLGWYVWLASALLAALMCSFAIWNYPGLSNPRRLFWNLTTLVLIAVEAVVSFILCVIVFGSIALARSGFAGIH